VGEQYIYMSFQISFFNAINLILPARGFFAWRRWFLSKARLQIARGVRISNGVRFYDEYIAIGEGTWVGPETSFFSTHCGRIVVGECVDIAPACKFFAGTHEISGPHRRAGIGRGKDIVVGNGSWIGGGSLLLPGVQLGPGTVVAAGSVVVGGRYAPNVMLAGVPARAVRALNEDYLPIAELPTAAEVEWSHA
jgi:maltose O-acetyltransferase